MSIKLWGLGLSETVENFLISTNVDVDQTLCAIHGSNRNTENIKIAKMPMYAEKNMRYAYFAEICEKCGIRIFA